MNPKKREKELKILLQKGDRISIDTLYSYGTKTYDTLMH